MSYGFAKLAHLVALILWIGPALGAYYFLWRATKEKDPEKIVWVERLTEKVLVLEHVALLFLILSGVWMLAAAGWSMLHAGWLKNKLLLFGLVLSFEAFDIYVAHRLFRGLLKRGVKVGETEWQRAELIRKGLVLIAIPVGLFLIPAILYLAVLKP